MKTTVKKALTMNAIINALTDNELTTKELASILNKDTSTILKFIKKHNDDNLISVTQTVTGNKYSVTQKIKFEDVFDMCGKKVVSNYNMIPNLRAAIKSEAGDVLKIFVDKYPNVVAGSRRYISHKDNKKLNELLG